MHEPPTPLYVRLAADQARRLDDAVSASGKTKRQLVEDAVREHLTDDGLVVGRIALREDPPEILTAGEAAALLRIDERELLAAAGRSELPGRSIGGEWRFSRVALLSWLSVESSSVGSAASPEDRSESVIETRREYAPGDPVRVLVRRREHRISVSDDGAAVAKAGRPPGWRAIAARVAEELDVNISRHGVISLPVVPVCPDEPRVVQRIGDASLVLYQELLELEAAI